MIFLKKYNSNKKLILLIFMFISIITSFYFFYQNKKENNIVNVYTHRHYNTDQQLFDKFTKKTNIKVNVINANADELIQRLKVEGKNSPADVLITVDAGRLERAKNKNLLQSIESEILIKNIPSYFRDIEGFWFGITYRGRIIAFAKERVNPKDFSTYENLSNFKWEGKILTRSSENIYNQSLLASVIIANGEKFSEKFCKSIVKNMSRSPKGSDKDQIKALASGIGDIAIVNTYYVGKLIYSDLKEERNAGESVSLFFPNQKERGTHINISGIGVARHAPHKKNAIKLLEFLSENEAQKLFAQCNFEYPVKKDIEWAFLLKSWGKFNSDNINLSLIGKNNNKAVKIFDKVNWR